MLSAGGWKAGGCSKDGVEGLRLWCRNGGVAIGTYGIADACLGKA